jgi:hypothetical protein
MSEHLSAGQPSVIYLDQLAQQEAIFRQIGTWAADGARTNEERRQALDELTMQSGSLARLPERLIPDYVLVSDVLRGEAPPLVLTEKPEAPLVYLAFLANELPWERKRALLALEAITAHNASEANELVRLLTNIHPNESVFAYVRRWLRPLYADGWTDTWVRKLPAAATSYLARLEYQTRLPVYEVFRAYCNHQTFRRAALVQLALAMYRHDHGEYPKLLSELVPDYLDQMPFDPFSGQQFFYRADGLELPLLGTGRSNYGRIEANTPLFWSVGAGDARLKQWYRTFEVEETDPPSELRVTTETVYQLTSDEALWMNEPAFVFPLPK